MTVALARTLRLGLVGGNITATRSPALHVVCGLSVGLNVTYDLLIPAELRLGFSETLGHCARVGFDGVNVTYPFKEEAAARIAPGDPVVRAMGSANTVTFGTGGPLAFNTDHSGFVAAFRTKFGAMSPGRVLVLGAGGVGRAVGFGLADLGASEIILHDTDPAKVAALILAIRGHADLPVSRVDAGMLHDLAGVDGVVNCTPLGMVGRPGTPLPDTVTGSPAWAFDAVYTPADTPFRRQMWALGAEFLGGYELYFHQGVRAFEIFAGTPVTDPEWVRSVLTHRG